MQGKHLFEYAVIRYVPRVEREEFLNVGVIVYCKSKGFLQVKYALDEMRLKHFFANADMEELEQRLQTFTKICEGKKEGGTVGYFPVAERFRWLTANRSTIVQSSAVHPGFCDDGDKMLNHLFEKLVL
ncbi:MAG: DUF3037 domain-containing protein [Sphingobacteriales bacterium]|nr:MAG: DUF3037 domain-containing protein [Sphingobacteriales bacterium]